MVFTGNTLQLLGFIFKVMVNFSSGGNSGDQLYQKKDETEAFSSSFLCQLQTKFCQSQSILLLTSLTSAYFWLFLLFNFSVLKHLFLWLYTSDFCSFFKIIPPLCLSSHHPGAKPADYILFLSALTPFVNKGVDS